MTATALEVAAVVLERTGERRSCTFAFGDAAPWRLELRGATPDPVAATASDLFESLAELRTALEARGARVLCEGACRDVFPSPMARQAGGGRFAYRIRVGEPTRREDRVDIFAPAPAERVASVAEQRAFARAWLDSLGRS